MRASLCVEHSFFSAGSTVVYPYNDTSVTPVELGASIFVEVNKNLWRATEDFKLKRVNFDDEDDTVGFWDGEQFLFVVGTVPFNNDYVTHRPSRWKRLRDHSDGGTQLKQYGVMGTVLLISQKKCKEFAP